MIPQWLRWREWYEGVAESTGFRPPSPDAERQVTYLPRSLDDALDALDQDHQFLTRDAVFPDALIHRWLEIKHAEISSIARRPHPYEYTMYFDF